MKVPFTFSAFAILALAGCLQQMGIGQTSENSGVSDLVGKRLIAKNIFFSVNEDGTMIGEFEGDPIVGTYRLTGSEICSSYTTPARFVGQEFCSTPQFSDNTVVFLRRDGSKSPTYRIEG